MHLYPIVSTILRAGTTTPMRLGERVRLEDDVEGHTAGTEGVVIGFVRNGDRPDALVSFEDGKSAVVPESKLSSVAVEQD
jgi:hypothetical protein